MTRCFILMGVTGCGKSSVGAALAMAAVCTYIDGDDLHSDASIQKMVQGIALGDREREPWLKDVGETLAKTDGLIVIGCSALKRKYRELIKHYAGEPVGFLHLHASKDIIAQRLSARRDHFMPVTLLASQFKELEPLEADETGWDIDVSKTLETVVSDAKNRVLCAYTRG